MFNLTRQGHEQLIPTKKYLTQYSLPVEDLAGGTEMEGASLGQDVTPSKQKIVK